MLGKKASKSKFFELGKKGSKSKFFLLGGKMKDDTSIARDPSD